MSMVLWGGLVLGVILVAIVVVGGSNDEPLDPRSTSPDGAKGMVDLASSFGAQIVIGTDQPAAGTDVSVLLRDTYGVAGRREIEDWVRAGGRLLVADRSSPLTPATEADGDEEARGPCAEPALEAVQTLIGTTGRFAPNGEITRCADGAIGIQALGRGTIVSVAGPAPVVNENLDRGDNAVLVVAVLAPTAGTVVTILEPRLVVGDTGERLVDLVPTVLWVLLVQVGVGFLLVVWWRMRRLGRPVIEHPQVAIEGSELAIARGRLLQSTHRPGAAAAELRADTRRQLIRRLGLPPDVPTAVLADRIARSGGLPAAEVSALLDHYTVTNDAELVDLAADLGRVRDAVLTAQEGR